MAIVPTKIPEKVAFYQSRVAGWTTNATAIGLSSSEMTTMSAKVTAAVNALADHIAAQQAAKDATIVMHDTVLAMGLYGADLIKKIKAKAGQSGNSVYALASLPSPVTPSPVGDPGLPTDFKVSLNQDGSVDLSWKCPNPPGAVGTLYQVFRRIGATGEFDYLGGSGQKAFTDATIPAGSSQVTYQIQAVRSTAIGPWAQFNVNFGVSSSGTTTASVEETTAKKAA